MEYNFNGIKLILTREIEEGEIITVNISKDTVNFDSNKRERQSIRTKVVEVPTQRDLTELSKFCTITGRCSECSKRKICETIRSIAHDHMITKKMPEDWNSENIIRIADAVKLRPEEF